MQCNWSAGGAVEVNTENQRFVFVVSTINVDISGFYAVNGTKLFQSATFSTLILPQSTYHILSLPLPYCRRSLLLFNFLNVGCLKFMVANAKSMLLWSKAENSLLSWFTFVPSSTKRKGNLNSCKCNTILGLELRFPQLFQSLPRIHEMSWEKIPANVRKVHFHDNSF